MSLLQQLITSRKEVDDLKKKLEQEKIDRRVEKQLAQERKDLEKNEKEEDQESSETTTVKRDISCVQINCYCCRLFAWCLV